MLRRFGETTMRSNAYNQQSQWEGQAQHGSCIVKLSIQQPLRCKISSD